MKCKQENAGRILGERPLLWEKRLSPNYVTMKLFEDLLADEEGHIDFLETQLALYESLGEKKYGMLNADSADDAE